MDELNKAFDNGIIKLRTLLLLEKFIKNMHITLKDDILPIYIVDTFKFLVDNKKIPNAGKATSEDLDRLLHHLFNI